MQHMTEGGFGRLQIVRVLDRDFKLVHRKAGPAALRVGKTGLLAKISGTRSGRSFLSRFFMLHLLSFSFRMCGFFRFYP